MCSRSIATFVVSTLYTKTAHDKLKSKISAVIHFPFKGGDKAFLIVVQHIGEKTKGRLGFRKKSF